MLTDVGISVYLGPVLGLGTGVSLGVGLGLGLGLGGGADSKQIF